MLQLFVGVSEGCFYRMKQAEVEGLPRDFKNKFNKLVKAGFNLFDLRQAKSGYLA